MAVLIRLAAAEDAAAIAAIYRPYVEQSRISFEEEAPDAVEMAGRMDSPLHPWLLAEEEGRILGYASSSPYHRRPAYRWTVETSIYLAADAQGRGVGRELLSSLVELLARQGYVTAIAAIALPNPISIALHERLGFAPTGTYRGVGFKLGQWTDVSLWQRDLAPRRAMTEAPLPFAQVRHPGLQQGSAFSPTAGRRGDPGSGPG
jgi:phosphinothricin acetyltransferase